MHSVRQNIRNHGFNVIGVMADDVHYPFTYTTGLGEILDGHPELVILGIDNHVAHHVIDAVVEYLKEGGRMPAGERVMVGSLPLRLEPVDLHSTWLEFGVTRRYYRDVSGWELKVMQVLVPDDERKLPGEHGADPECVRAQDSVNLPAG